MGRLSRPWLALRVAGTQNRPYEKARFWSKHVLVCTRLPGTGSHRQLAGTIGWTYALRCVNEIGPELTATGPRT